MLTKVVTPAVSPELSFKNWCYYLKSFCTREAVYEIKTEYEPLSPAQNVTMSRSFLRRKSKYINKPLKAAVQGPDYYGPPLMHSFKSKYIKL
jgi:hypothetical protein